MSIAAHVTQTNKEIVLRLFGAFAESDDTTMDALLASDFVGHGMPSALTPDRQGVVQCSRVIHSALTECHAEVEDVIAEDDRVAIRYTTRARHTGELFGAAPSGRSVTMTGIEMYRVCAGRIVEAWWQGDMSELFAE